MALLTLLIILEVEDAVLFALAQHHRSNVAGPADPGFFHFFPYLSVIMYQEYFEENSIYIINNQVAVIPYTSEKLIHVYASVLHMCRY